MRELLVVTTGSKWSWGEMEKDSFCSNQKTVVSSNDWPLKTSIHPSKKLRVANKMSLARRVRRGQYNSYGKVRAGNSGCMQPACGTVLACKPIRALQARPTPLAAFC